MAAAACLDEGAIHIIVVETKENSIQEVGERGGGERERESVGLGMEFSSLALLPSIAVLLPASHHPTLESIEMGIEGRK